MKRHYHFIGIGGIGMSGIARLLLERGMVVSGSDLKGNAITAELQKQGAKIFIGHHEKNINGAQVVVYSSAIKEDNPELKKAIESGVRLIRRAEALAELMEDKTVITVTGSHGKTTTTSLASFMLIEAGLAPTVAVGGILRNIGNNAYSGSSDLFVAEADESDGSFLYYSPKYNIITNIDREHLDYYGTFENAVAAYKKFMLRTAKGGCLFCCADDINLAAIAADYKGKCVLFGLNKQACLPDRQAHIYPDNTKIDGLSSEFDCFYRGKFVDRFKLALGGEHNISNALAVIALGLELKIEVKFIKSALSKFKGAGRRLEVKLQDKGRLFIDDYAHHPTEIKATLAALKKLKRRRIIAIFQPHRYSRTKLLLDEFAACFGDADYLVITDIYPAAEPPIEGVSAELIYKKIKARDPFKEVCFLPKDKIVTHIRGILRPDDLVITLGAGDIVKKCDELVAIFKGKG